MSNATPRPWNNGVIGYSITGPTTPSFGVTVEESLDGKDWERGGYKGDRPVYHAPITVGQRTVAIAVWEKGNEPEGHANAALIVEAVNAYDDLLAKSALLDAMKAENEALRKALEDARTTFERLHNNFDHRSDAVYQILEHAEKDARAALGGGK